MQNEEISPAQNKQAVLRLGIRPGKKLYDNSGFFYCPHHKDTKPSFSVNFRKGVYHCFSCKDGGTLNSLCWKISNRSIQDVLGLSEESFNIYRKMQQEYKPEPEKTEKDSRVDVRGVLVPFYQSPAALEYLKIRGIPTSVAESMQMQYTEEATFNGKWYSKRLLIPIYGEDGHLVSVEGRDVTFNDDVPKCLYPTNTIKSVYEWYKLKRDEPVYLFEGLIKMAVARSDSYFANSTSLYGTGFKPYQISLLNLFSHVILVPDNDAPGKELITALQKALSTKFSTLQIKDPLLKDVDEIPTKKHTTVKEYRENGGFLASSVLSLVF
jgi:DNA primase